MGFCWEGDEINGIVYFLEYMVFKGIFCLVMGEFEWVIELRGVGINVVIS